MRRVEKPVTLAEARTRLKFYRKEQDSHGPFKASALAEVIWPNARFIRSQGAGAAATRVLKRLGCYWGGDKYNWGWFLYFKD